MSASDDDVPQLSIEAFSALQEFYKEQEHREQQEFLAVETLEEQEEILSEDWQLSQFWYDDNTIEVLVDTALKAVGPNGNIALVSCPSLYKKLRQKANPNCEITLFEFDKRFRIYGKDFIPYDYNSPLAIPREKQCHYDIVLADPPFLSDECLTKMAVTMKFLTKRKILLCTGAVMADLALRLLEVEKTKFKPKHTNNIGNEFCCYANFYVDICDK